jgi:hypothetical protein
MPANAIRRAYEALFGSGPWSVPGDVSSSSDDDSHYSKQDILNGTDKARPGAV